LKVHLEDLSHVYVTRGGSRSALEIKQLDVESRAKLCLTGSSGSGKTTLLNILAGILVPTAGTVLLGETDLFTLSEAGRDGFRSRSIGCVFQTFNLLQGLSALENLTLAQRFAGISGTRAKQRALELLEVLGLSDRAEARPAELSVGEQQRVAIARAVSKRPALVLADEPTASLDDANAYAAIDLLLQACGESTLIVVSHDVRLIHRFEHVGSVAELASLGEAVDRCA
jgi:ABC-type lipoprotein export system ATPase subunit